ncbi:MAG: LLM class flavin-dependent oxidoreductase, partial [Spirochaeta sp.]|nr:LLM class flavin-dependent oxidoreductase [Spirochaeta sp.]
MDYRFDPARGLEFGLYTLGDHLPNPLTGERISAQERIREIVELARLADQAGIDFFSVGESHQEYFATQANAVVLAAIAEATESIRIGSSSSIISTSDPVRVYENFATLDLLSGGRAEIVELARLADQAG